ncbi:MAG TPA: DUF1573 domain-containing protein [Thermoanaerobaculia bacterium]|nr:DUF1573 domain-containing protein [Thermoanaerobaculia bacterium]
MMRRIGLYPTLLGLVALTALGLPTAAQQADEATGAPKAVVPQPVHDAQTVPKGQNVVHDFRIVNEGTAPLEITDVRPTCGCTVAEFDKVIAPGASGKIHVVLDTSTFDGGIAKTVMVFTNDPANPRFNLTIKAEVQPFIFVNPGYARFIQPQLSEPGVVEQLVWTSSFDQLEVASVTSPYPFLTVEHRPATAEERRAEGTGPQYVLRFVLDYEKAPIGTLAEYVTVDTNHPRQSVVKIPISGFVRPMVVVTPAEADFGDIEVAGEPVTARLILKNYAREDLQVQPGSVDVPGMAVDVDPVDGEEGRSFNVLVELGPGVAKGPFQGTIRLRTDHPKKPFIDIPVKGRVI